MKVITNFAGLKSTGRPAGNSNSSNSGNVNSVVAPAEQISTPNPSIDIGTNKTRGTFKEILEIGQQNAKCEVDYSQIKLEEGNVGTWVRGQYKFNDDNLDDNLKLIELSKEFSKQMDNYKKVLKIDDEEDLENNQKIKYPLEQIRVEMRDLCRQLRAISYITICQMYDGILIPEQLSLRKGEAYEYKHQHHIYMDTFFNLIMKNKLEVYKKLGFEKSVLIEEILNRLIAVGILKKRDKEKGDTSEDKWDMEDGNSSYRNSSAEWEERNSDLIEELSKIGEIKIKLNKPFEIINLKREAYERLIVTGIKIKQDEGVEFLGKNVEETYDYENKLDLNVKVYNYVYKLHEKPIKDVMGKAEYYMKKLLAERQTHHKIMLDKCQKFLLVAKIMNVDVDEVTRRY